MGKLALLSSYWNTGILTFGIHSMKTVFRPFIFEFVWLRVPEVCSDVSAQVSLPGSRNDCSPPPDRRAAEPQREGEGSLCELEVRLDLVLFDAMLTWCLLSARGAAGTHRGETWVPPLLPAVEAQPPGPVAGGQLRGLPRWFWGLQFFLDYVFCCSVLVPPPSLCSALARLPGTVMAWEGREGHLAPDYGSTASRPCCSPNRGEFVCFCTLLSLSLCWSALMWVSEWSGGSLRARSLHGVSVHEPAVLSLRALQWRERENDKHMCYRMNM